VITYVHGELIRELRQVQSRLEARLADVLAGEGMTVAEWWVLDCLAETPGRPTSEVAAHALLPGPSLTKVVDGLVDRNHVYRRNDSADRRRLLLFPTVRGMQRHAEVRAVVDSAAEDLAEAVGVDAVDGLYRALREVAGHLG
jgi:DNA-binding MarR family transcriptional regulator